MSDIHFEAACLRAALLVGLMNEREVPAWAMERSTSSAGWTRRWRDSRPNDDHHSSSMSLTPISLRKQARLRARLARHAKQDGNATVTAPGQ